MQSVDTSIVIQSNQALHERHLQDVHTYNTMTSTPFLWEWDSFQRHDGVLVIMVEFWHGKEEEEEREEGEG
jgi:hypothetical protein